MLISYIKSNLRVILIALVVAVITPIIIGLVLNIPTGKLTIGDENSWVGFFGSYTGGIIGGIVALIISSSQLINERKRFNLSQRSYLSAATIVANFSKREFHRRKKNRIAMTPSFTSLFGTDHDVIYYSVIRHGGPDVIANCKFKIIVGNDSKFEKVDTINVWIDFFDKDEEILIPLCSDKLSKEQKYEPFVKEIEVVYETIAGEKIKFVQSEKDKRRAHILIKDNTEILNQDLEYTAFTTKGE